MISFEIGGGRIALYGDPAAPLWFLQMVDDHDAGLMESEAEEIAGLAGGTGCRGGRDGSPGVSCPAGASGSGGASGPLPSGGAVTFAPQR